METINSLLALLTGLLVRLAIPITVTAVLIYLLRQLDARWQAEARLVPLHVQKPKCWEIKGCTPEQRRNCPSTTSPLPCWQVHRQSNGYMREECLGCKVFHEAPVPA